MIPVKVHPNRAVTQIFKLILVRKCLEDLYPTGFKIYNLCSEHKSFQRAKDVDGKKSISLEAPESNLYFGSG